MLYPFPYVSCLLPKALSPPYVHIQRLGGFVVSYCLLFCSFVSLSGTGCVSGKVKIVISYIYCLFQPQPVRPWEQGQWLQPHPGRAREALEIKQG